MKFTLAQKGIILVAIPILFELIFLTALSILLGQAEQESSEALQASRVGDCSNVLIRDVFELTSMTKGDIAQALTSEWYSKTVKIIRSDLDALKNAVKDDPVQERVVQESLEAGEEALLLMGQLHNTIESGNPLQAIDKLRLLRDELRSCAKRVISRDLVEMALREKLKAEKIHAKQVEFRNGTKSLLVYGVILNIIIAVVVVLIFSKKIVKRLNIVMDNNFRLVSGLPLHPLVGGSDEIATLDLTFHELADSLSQAKAKEKAMIEHSADVICSLDTDGKVTSANPACRRVLGYPEDLILGMNLRSILLKEDIELFNEALLTAKAEESETQCETRIQRNSGGTVDVSWSVHWVESEKSFFCVGHDISSRKEMERLKQKFMAMVSHDLRTPLAIINNYFEMLSIGLFGQLTERGEHLLHVAESNVSRMLCLINDLLDLERAEFGGLKVDAVVQNLSSLFERAVKSVADLASRKSINIDVASTDLEVLADEHRILQVLTNLLSNAIKFSSENGSIRISADVSGKMAIIKISDQGRGVPEDMKEAIFERFQQVDKSDAINLGGSGLGLAICKTLVELHGGQISVSNNIDKGSTFSFSLPLAKYQEERIA